MERTTNRKMTSPMTSIKVALISTGIVAMYLFVKSCVPIVVDFSLSRFPVLWSSFLSWLKPPYLFVIVNVIIVTTIVASSRYFQSISIDDPDCEVKDVDMDGYFVALFPPPIVVSDVDRSEVVCEEKEEKDISGLNNGGDDFMLLTWKLNQKPSMMEGPEIEKRLVSAISGHPKPVKVAPKGGNRRKASRVVKPKLHETTTENTWKMMVTEEVKSTLLTSYCRRPETFGLGVGGSQSALRKSETFRDMTNNYRKSPTVTSPVKMKKEISPSREELNRKCEAFIKKSKEEMLESLSLDKEARLISF